MKVLNIFTKNKIAKNSKNFADFFLHASNKDKKRVFKKAAKQANRDQRTLVEEDMSRNCISRAFRHVIRA